MSESLQATRLQLLKDFAQAWNDHDIEALMACMSEDCRFDSSAGADIFGNRAEGLVAVRESYLAIFKVFPDAKWNEDTHFVAGDRGVSEWRFTGAKADGSSVNLMGCDLFEFAGDKIKVKDSYRKTPA
ncbi:nuclear transport factor 2 family protein [uncultured Pseudoteredinibacter sp.]|uniref:nuclear transport factor 2 family protein n=1 Tax=uncultured Pseudoteredinibacter sp. TaxID=1641701 RepID=UPI002627F1AE|nr:nuclear transport factor 2 family protein [uncultured Pseudoteredinibacter sp.]